MKRHQLFPFIALLLVLILAGGCGGAEDEVINITTAQVKTISPLADITYTGLIKADTTAEIAASISGTVVSLPVAEGQAVSKGQVLFTLDSTDIELQVKQAEASLHAAQVALDSAAAAQAADSVVIPAKTASQDAHTNYDRVKSLYDAGAVSEADYEAARSKMETADAQLTAAQISQKSSYDNAAAAVETARAAYNIAAQKLSNCTVTAPISGQVTQIEIENGAVVSPSVKTMTVIDNSKLKVAIDVLERDMEKVSPGMPATIQVQAIGESCQGTVTEIAPAANTNTGLFQVYVGFDPQSTHMLAGMTANVTLLDAGADAATASWYVPTQSLFEEQGQTYVFLVSGDQVHRQAVTLGKEKNEYTEIQDGLTADAVVVVQAGGELTDGAKIRVLKN